MMTEPTTPQEPEPIVTGTAVRKLSRRQIVMIATATVVVLAMVVALMIFRPWQQRADAAPSPEPTVAAEPTPTATPFATPGPQAPVALASAPGASDVFDDWSARTSSPEVTMLASDDMHDGAYSLNLLSAAPSGAIAAQYESVAHLQPGLFYTATAWVKSAGMARGAVEFRPGSGWETSVSVPAGSYDWQQISVHFQATGAAATFRIVVKGPTDGLLIDSVTYAADDGSPVVFPNGGFELNSADLAVLNPSLILVEGEASVSLTTRRAPDGWLTWEAVDVDGTVAASGAEHFTGLAAAVPLNDLDPGFYSLAVKARIGAKEIDRTTTVGVVADTPYEGALADSPYGIHLHYGDSRERDAATIDTLAALGIGHVRADVVWHKSELERNRFTFPEDTSAAMAALQAHGMSALQVPVYANPLYDEGKTPSTPQGLAAYGQYTANVLGTFPGVGQTVEVYNEFDHFFNTGACGPTPECYIPMLDAVNAAAPDATVVAPSLAGMGFKWDWLQQFFALGGLDRIDAVTAHPYTQPEPASGLGQDLDRLTSMMEEAGGAKPIWLTEMGWATVENWVSDDQQAAYLVQTMATSFGHGVERVYWYEAVDQRSNPADYEGNFGLFESSRAIAPLANAPKRAAVAQSVVAQMLEGREPGGKDKVQGVESYRFGNGADELRVMWVAEGEKDVVIESNRDVTITDIYGRETTLKPKSGAVEVMLGITPVYIDGEVSVKVTKR